jgi:hypothetical protein
MNPPSRNIIPCSRLEPRLSQNSNKANKATTLAGYGITDAQSKLTNPLTKSDIVNNLTSTSTNTPLSAYQGKILKAYIDKIGKITDKTSEETSTTDAWETSSLSISLSAGTYIVFGNIYNASNTATGMSLYVDCTSGEGNSYSLWECGFNDKNWNGHTAIAIYKLTSTTSTLAIKRQTEKCIE